MNELIWRPKNNKYEKNVQSRKEDKPLETIEEEEEEQQQQNEYADEVKEIKKEM